MHAADVPVLVTGGAGFIGSNLVDALVDAGHPVAVFDDLSTGRLENLDGAFARGVRLFEGDVTDVDRVDDVFAAVRPAWVFHLAAQIDVRRSLEAPGFDALVNVVGTANVLEAARRHGAVRVVNTSTGGAIYGHADVVPTPEGAPERPLAAYGTSKLCAEQYVAWSARLHGLSASTVRLANVYGPRQDPLGEAGVIAILCDRVLEGRAATIFGDGSQTRDFVYVGDVVRAQLAVARAGRPVTVNVGTGVETSVLGLVGAVAAAAGRPIVAPEFALARTGEVHRSCLDVARLRDELGVVAETSLVAGLRHTLGWMAARPPVALGMAA